MLFIVSFTTVLGAMEKNLMYYQIFIIIIVIILRKMKLRMIQLLTKQISLIFFKIIFQMKTSFIFLIKKHYFYMFMQLILSVFFYP